MLRVRTYVARRLLQGVLVLWLVSLLIFSLVRILPGDAVIMQLDQAAAPSPDVLKRARQELGLDRPFVDQYRTWIGAALQGDLGRSLISRRPVTQELGKRINLTTHLAVMSVIIAMLIALPIGVLSAVRQDTASDYLGRFFAVLGLSLPDFWLGTLVITFAAIWFNWIPPIGYVSLWDSPWKNLQQFLVPAAILGFRLSAATMRMTRSTVLEVLREDYVRTAWAKGLAGKIVVYKHALKNALIPVVTIVGGQLGTLLAGTVVVETIFALPGMGRLTVEAILYRDYPIVQTNVMLVAATLVTLNLIVDLTYAWLDPRIRYS